jgi:hypothetical protein
VAANSRLPVVARLKTLRLASRDQSCVCPAWAKRSSSSVELPTAPLPNPNGTSAVAMSQPPSLNLEFNGPQNTQRSPRLADEAGRWVTDTTPDQGTPGEHIP